MRVNPFTLSSKTSRRHPLVRWLVAKVPDGVVPDGYRPKTARELPFALGWVKLSKSNRPGPGHSRAVSFWKAVIPWLPEHPEVPLRCSTSFPAAITDVFRLRGHPHLTPLHFAMSDYLYNSPLTGAPGSPELWAAVYGWELDETELEAAAGCALTYADWPPFCVWSWGVNLLTVPLPTTRDGHLKKRLARSHLVEHPLRTSKARLKLALSPIYTPARLAVLPRSPWTPRLDGHSAYSHRHLQLLPEHHTEDFPFA